MTIARQNEPMRRWSLGMALEIVVYLSAIAASALVALAAWLVF